MEEEYTGNTSSSLKKRKPKQSPQSPERPAKKKKKKGDDIDSPIVGMRYWMDNTTFKTILEQIKKYSTKTATESSETANVLVKEWSIEDLNYDDENF